MNVKFNGLKIDYPHGFSIEQITDAYNLTPEQLIKVGREVKQ